MDDCVSFNVDPAYLWLRWRVHNEEYSTTTILLTHPPYPWELMQKELWSAASIGIIRATLDQL